MLAGFVMHFGFWRPHNNVLSARPRLNNLEFPRPVIVRSF